MQKIIFTFIVTLFSIGFLPSLAQQEGFPEPPTLDTPSNQSSEDISWFLGNWRCTNILTFPNNQTAKSYMTAFHASDGKFSTSSDVYGMMNGQEFFIGTATAAGTYVLEKNGSEWISRVTITDASMPGGQQADLSQQPEPTIVNRTQSGFSMHTRSGSARGNCVRAS